MTRITSIAWGLLAVSLAALGLVFYWSMSLTAAAEAQGQAVSNAAQGAQAAAYAQRLHGIFANTVESRSSLESALHSDVVQIANAIDAVGTIAGVTARVSDAVPQGEVVQFPGGGSAQVIEFAVLGTGDFQNLMHAVSLYATMPLPLQVHDVQMQRDASTGRKTAKWNMTVHIRVLMGSTITI